jgi:hypothetical protein
MQASLTVFLQASAAAQFGVAVINFFLVKQMDWGDDLKRMSLLPREVFMVHLWFISITLLIFGVLTWRFAEPMAAGTNPVAAWLVGSIAIFWGVRTVLQVTYYSSQHWRGKPAQTVAHVVLLVVCGGMTATYACAAYQAI